MLKNKSAIVTGSTSGIGLAIAQTLAGEGCHILFNGFGDRATIDALVADTANKYGVKTADIRDMVKLAESTFGAADILVNNAGIQHTASIEEFPEEKWDAILAINLSSAFHATKAALPGMRARGFGRIVNIASVHGLVGSKNKSAYVAAKHGIVGLTKVTALESAEAGITCNAICPGWVRTPLVEKQIDDKAGLEKISKEEAANKLLGEKQPNRRFIAPESIGAMIVFLCSDHGASMTGEIITMDGGWVAQ
jgi:3-hydroxybutyrate dehydrogenase